MRNFFRYLLVLSVLAIGYYGASQHRLTDELSETVEEVQSDPPIHPATSTGDSPLSPAKARPTPLAALIDTDRSLMTEAQVDPRATVKNPPEIARALPQTPPNNVESSPHEREVPRPKRRPQNALSGKPSQTIPESSAQDVTLLSRERSQDNNDISSSQQDAPWDMSRPADQPRGVPTLASKQSDSPSFPLPPLAARPGDRFIVSDPPESAPTNDSMDDEEHLPKGGGSRQPLGQQPARPNDSNDASSAHRVTDQPSSPRTHTIQVGDTLSKLAERYLGDRQKSEIIYRANSDVLIDPRLLPIGVDLKIPTRVESEDSEDRQTRWASGPEQKNDPLDDLFEEPSRPEEPAGPEEPVNDLEPIPPQALPSFQMNPWRHSGR